MAVEISMSDLKARVEAGEKRDALAEHYGLPKQQMSNLLKQAGLKIRKFHAPKFVLVDDTVQPTSEVVETVVEDAQVVEAPQDEVATMPEPAENASW